MASSPVSTIYMSQKRKSDATCDTLSGTKRQRTTDASSATVQLSLHRFFKSNPSEGSTGDSAAGVITPEYFGIHIYTNTKIEDAAGLEKDYRTFWNEKAIDMCSDKYTRAKLSRDKVAVQGAINTSCTLHKVELLELKAEEMKA